VAASSRPVSQQDYGSQAGTYYADGAGSRVGSQGGKQYAAQYNSVNSRGGPSQDTAYYGSRAPSQKGSVRSRPDSQASGSQYSSASRPDSQVAYSQSGSQYGNGSQHSISSSGAKMRQQQQSTALPNGSLSQPPANRPGGRGDSSAAGGSNVDEDDNGDIAESLLEALEKLEGGPSDTNTMISATSPDATRAPLKKKPIAPVMLSVTQHDLVPPDEESPSSSMIATPKYSHLAVLRSSDTASNHDDGGRRSSTDDRSLAGSFRSGMYVFTDEPASSPRSSVNGRRSAKSSTPSTPTLPAPPSAPRKLSVHSIDEGGQFDDEAARSSPTPYTVQIDEPEDAEEENNPQQVQDPWSQFNLSGLRGVSGPLSPIPEASSRSSAPSPGPHDSRGRAESREQGSGSRHIVPATEERSSAKEIRTTPPDTTRNVENVNENLGAEGDEQQYDENVEELVAMKNAQAEALKGTIYETRDAIAEMKSALEQTRSDLDHGGNGRTLDDLEDDESWLLSELDRLSDKYRKDYNHLRRIMAQIQSLKQDRKSSDPRPTTVSVPKAPQSASGSKPPSPPSSVGSARSLKETSPVVVRSDSVSSEAPLGKDEQAVGRKKGILSWFRRR